MGKIEIVPELDSTHPGATKTNGKGGLSLQEVGKKLLSKLTSLLFQWRVQSVFGPDAKLTLWR